MHLFFQRKQMSMFFVKDFVYLIKFYFLVFNDVLIVSILEGTHFVKILL